MVPRSTLLDYLHHLLQVTSFKDYCPNGLQVEGRDTIHLLVTGVTACEALIQKAITMKADAILVHHGYFWKGQSPCVTGMHRQRLNLLLKNHINLLTYHLPLDAHLIYGNNAQLAERLSIHVQGQHPTPWGVDLLWHGTFDPPLSPAQCMQRIEQALQRAPIHLPAKQPKIRSIGWCSGAGQSLLETAAQLKLDAYLTGEASEPTFHIAREYNIHTFIAGHHATERYGVQALGQHLAKHFHIEHCFIDIDNPI